MIDHAEGDADPGVPPDVSAVADRLYADSRASLRALHDAVLELTHALGDDVRARPATDRVEVVRRTVFLDLRPGPDDTLQVSLYDIGEPPDDEPLPTSQAAGTGRDPTTRVPAHVVHLPWDAMDQDVIALEPLIEAAYDQHA